MKIAIIFNTMSHHIKPLCDALYKCLGDNFVYMQTAPMRKDRIDMGWGMDISSIPYVHCLYKEPKKCRIIAETFDVVLFGSAPLFLIQQRVKDNKMTIYVAERIFRNGIVRILYPPTFITVLKRFIIPGNKSNFFMFCAGPFTALDMSRIGAFKNRCYKWGHFIPVYQYEDLNAYRKENTVIEILWCGRFLKLKHPEYPILLAERLKQQNIPFHVTMVGDGDEFDNMLNLMKEKELFSSVNLVGMRKPQEVREMMLCADIYAFTSDFGEGWGAVVNESMNAGCAVISSSAPGAANYLIEDGKNGFIYECGNIEQFLKKSVMLFKNEELRLSLGYNAYKTITNKWSAEMAAHRLISFSQAVLTKQELPEYTQGPLSKAEIISNNWYKEV